MATPTPNWHFSVCPNLSLGNAKTSVEVKLSLSILVSKIVPLLFFFVLKHKSIYEIKGWEARPPSHSKVLFPLSLLGTDWFNGGEGK